MEVAGVDWLHQDVMDGRFVPNLALGIDVMRAMAGAVRVPHDVHLMVEEPEKYVAMFAGLPGARVTFHPEATRHPVAVITAIRAAGAVPGLALSPAVPVASVGLLLPLVDQVTVMTVNPGFAGQALLEWCLPKVAEVRAWAEAHRPELVVAVDGNVSWANIPRMVAAGADALVLGTSSLFQKGLGREDAWRRLRELTGRE